MLEYLSDLDTKLFLILNGAHHPWLDWPFFLISGKITWVPLYAWLLWLLAKKNGIGLWFTIICVVLMIFVADTGAGEVKNFVMRFRPTRNPEIADFVHTVNNYRGGRFGFFSAHAANTFALAMFVSLSLNSRRMLIFLLLWAFIVSYSRVYLGVHYPGDIMVGMIYGIIIGRFFFWFERRVSPLVRASVPEDRIRSWVMSKLRIS